MVESDPGRKDAIEETFEDRREIEPPLRKDEYESVRSPQPLDPAGDPGGVVTFIEIAAPLATVSRGSNPSR